MHIIHSKKEILKELSKLDKEEIKQLNNKVSYLEKSINTWEQKDSLNKEIIY